MLQRGRAQGECGKSKQLQGSGRGGGYFCRSHRSENQLQLDCPESANVPTGNSNSNSSPISTCFPSPPLLFILQVIRNVTRKFHDAIVKCEVQNSVGKSEDSETLDISCKYKRRYLPPPHSLARQ